MSAEQFVSDCAHAVTLSLFLGDRSSRVVGKKRKPNQPTATAGGLEASGEFQVEAPAVARNSPASDGVASP